MDTGATPPAKGGMGVHTPTLRDADRGIPKRGGVAPVNGRLPRSGNTVPAAVPQLQENQPYTEALARTWKWRFGAHAPRCLMCTRRSAPPRPDPPRDPSPEGFAAGFGVGVIQLAPVGQIGQDYKLPPAGGVGCRR